MCALLLQTAYCVRLYAHLQKVPSTRTITIMKPQQLAQVLNITPTTLRRWAGKEYAEFLSPAGQGINGAKRSFTEQDSRILAWIAQMRTQNTSPKDILMTLRSAKANNWHDLPPMPGGMSHDEPIAVVPREAVEERLRALQERYETQLQLIVKERDELKAHLEAARRESEAARREASETVRMMQQETAETIKSLQRDSSDTIKALQQRLSELTVQEAELRGKLEQYTVGGRRWSVLALVAAALLIGVVLTLLILLIVTLSVGAK
jgi:DNA-binding transcriptional MerR regulator